MRVLLLLALVAASTFGTGCSITELDGSWMSPRYSGDRFTRVVVLGVTRDTTLRRVAEDAFVSELAGRGIQAVPSYEIFPSDPETLTRAQIEQAVQQQDVEGVIVARVAKVEKETRSSGSFASSAGAGGFVGRYQQGWAGSCASGATFYRYDVVTVEVQLFDLKTNQLVWSAQTRTFDPRDLESTSRGWAKVVVGAMAKRHIV